MKIGILTFHHAHNYGAVLQAYALKKYVENLGHEVEVVNYQNKKIASGYPKSLMPHFKASTLNPKNWKQFLYDIYLAKMGNKEWKTRYDKFDCFIGENLLANHVEADVNQLSVIIDLSGKTQSSEGKRLSDFKVLSEEDMTKIEKDAWLLGSDQIWSSFLLGYLDPVYFGARKAEGKVISYAPSMLHAELADGEEEEFKQLLENVDIISAREEQLSETLRKLSGREVTTTCDPTLLLEAEDFAELYEDKHPRNGEKYVFAYFVVEEKMVEEYARRIADEMGCKLIELHYQRIPEINRDNVFCDFGPGEFLQYIKYAECVVTNSFHGAVFSVLFEKKFYSVFWKNGRVSNLMETLGLSNRIFTQSEEIDQAISCIPDEINYEAVKERLSNYREASRDFLKSNLR